MKSKGKPSVPMPVSVTVGPYLFAVQSDAAQFLNAEESEGSRLYGRTNLLSGVIDIRPQTAVTMNRETLLHEILHTIFFLTKITSDKEEEFVGRIAPALLDVLRKNPDVVRYLLDG